MSQYSEVCVSCSVAMAREAVYSPRCAERSHFHMALSAWRALEPRWTYRFGGAPVSKGQLHGLSMESEEFARYSRAREEYSVR